MTKVYEIQSFDATDLEKFYLQTSEQIWYVLNAKRIKNTPEKERDELWEIENKRLQTVEKKFLIHSEDGYEDIDIGYLFGFVPLLYHHLIIHSEQKYCGNIPPFCLHFGVSFFQQYGNRCHM